MSARSATLAQCAILAGGLATRLGAIAAEVPKPVLDVGGRPFIAWIMQAMLRVGVERFVILTGHLSDAVRAAVTAAAATLPRPVELAFSHEPERAGTGGALHHARALLDERFLLCNGDSLLACNLGALLRDFAADGDEVLARLVVREIADAGRYGSVRLQGDRVAAFAERPAGAAAPVLINAGLYAIDRRLLDRLSPACSLERDVLPALAAEGTVRASVQAGWFVDIGIAADLERARRELPHALPGRALFLDRDGVLNLDHGYVGGRDRWQWVQGAREAVALACDRGWHAFVVTNQAGVARGFYGEAEVQALMAWVADELRRAGGTLDDWRYCPFHAEATIEAYRRESDWRKPAPGMILDLLARWRLEPSRCLMIGDTASDMAAAAAAGVPGHLFPGGDLRAFAAPLLGA